MVGLYLAVILCVGEGFDIICASGGEEIKVLGGSSISMRPEAFTTREKSLGDVCFISGLCLSMHTNFFLSLSLNYP